MVAPKDFTNHLTMSVPDAGYSGNTSWELSLISTYDFSLYHFKIKLWLW